MRAIAVEEVLLVGLTKEDKLLMDEIKKALMPLTPKRRKLAIGIAGGLCKKHAAAAAGYSKTHNHGGIKGAENDLNWQVVMNKLDHAAVHGLTKDLLFGKHKQLIDAKKVLSTPTGLVEVADNATQAKILELGYKVLGVLTEESVVTIETHEQRMARLRGDSCD
jgi:hypothetical protein